MDTSWLAELDNEFLRNRPNVSIEQMYNLSWHLISAVNVVMVEIKGRLIVVTTALMQ